MKDKEMISMKYGGMQISYMIIFFLIYSIILIIIECTSTVFKKVENKKIEGEVKDENVQKEIDRANSDDNINVNNNNVNNNINNENENNHNNSKENNYINNNNNNNNEIVNNNNNIFAVKIENLQKNYKKYDEACCGCCCAPTIQAIKNLNICLEYGECFGLLGLNGAGKTTTFKCITHEHGLNNGKIKVNGIDISEDFDSISHMFGYCPQFDAIFEFMTVKENLEFYARIKGVKNNMIDKLIKAMIEEMSLNEFVNKISGRLSGGNKRKLSVAISMIGNPPIILLDEPSTGMDPEARRFMWNVIHKISSRRKKSAVI